MAAIAWVETLADFGMYPTRKTVKGNSGLVLRDNELPVHAEDVVYWMNKCNTHKGVFVVLYAQKGKIVITVTRICNDGIRVKDGDITIFTGINCIKDNKWITSYMFSKELSLIVKKLLDDM